MRAAAIGKPAEKSPHPAARLARIGEGTAAGGRRVTSTPCDRLTAGMCGQHETSSGSSLRAIAWSIRRMRMAADEVHPGADAAAPSFTAACAAAAGADSADPLLPPRLYSGRMGLLRSAGCAPVCVAALPATPGAARLVAKKLVRRVWPLSSSMAPAPTAISPAGLAATSASMAARSCGARQQPARDPDSC